MRSESNESRGARQELGSAPHVPVLLLEAIESLNIKPEGIYVDGTFGRGGHAKEILKRLKGNGLLVAIEWQLPACIDYRQVRLTVECLADGAWGTLWAWRQ